jgi:hypothetical protein
MKLMVLKTLDRLQKEAVRKLWNEEYPKSIVLKTPQDLSDYLEKLHDQNHILLQDKNNEIIGWFFGFMRDSERWFAIIVNSKKHKKGYGTALLNKAKSLYAELNGWVITDATHTKQDSSAYISPLGFYLKSGFSVLENETFETDKMKTVKIKWIKE